MRVINDRCNRFEAAWRAGGRPDLEEFLTGLDPDTRATVRAELAAIDAEYREAGDGPPAFGEYAIMGQLGAGGMGSVYLARHQFLDRPVALKVIAPALANTASARSRFRREMRLAGRLSHPNLVAVHDAAEDRGRLYLVTEYVDGIDLSALVRRDGPLPVARAVDYVLQAAAGLAHAHERGIIHRDVKPSNLIVGNDGVVRVLDLGLARATDTRTTSTSELTRAGELLGTPAYAAPEQLDSPDSADVRADVYGLGGALHYLLCGRPYRGHGVPPGVPRRVARVLGRMLADNPADRPESMSDVIDQLRAAVRRPRRARLAAQVALVAGLAILTAAAAIPPPVLPPPPPEPIIAPPTPAVVVEDMPVSDPADYQRRWANALGLPVEFKNDFGVEFVLVPPGRYRIGDPGDNGPVVNVYWAYYLSKTEVTIRQVRTLIGRDPLLSYAERTGKAGRRLAYGKHKGEWVVGAGRRWDDAGPEFALEPDFPAINLTWDDCVEIARVMTQRASDGRVYRLATEAEWEHACRGGRDTTWCHGNEAGEALGLYAVFDRPDPAPTTPGRRPNGWGLCDMHGNLPEWVGNTATGLPGPVAVNDRVIRGGKFNDKAQSVRSAARLWENRTKPLGGLRLVCMIGD
jgi:serine/threonine-protein kinase